MRKNHRRKAMKKILFLLISVFLLVSCAEDTPIQESTPEAPEIKEDATYIEEPTPVTVSPLAEENFLEPIEDFSWEREFPVEYVMLHFTSAVAISKNDPYNIDSVRSIFEENELSIHYLIDRDGKIYCYMPEDRVAWHAGVGRYADDEKYTNNMNRYSIGIEMLAIGSMEDMSIYLTPSEYGSLDESLIGFTDAQYNSLATLLSDVCERNSIPFDAEHIIGHEDYNPLKNDPGDLFDKSRIFE
jgi:N-acetylmuramoyl-L-alanine amidase